MEVFAGITNPKLDGSRGILPHQKFEVCKDFHDDRRRYGD